MALFGIQIIIIIRLRESNEVMKSMNKNCIELMMMHGVEFEKGLTYEEIVQIEKIYQIIFPNSLRKFLMTALPISNGFYNWRNTENPNIEFIKEVIRRPIEEIDKSAEEVYWCDDWGDEPEDVKDVAKEVRERLKKAPKLVPIYAHRYLPITLDENPPIISVHNLDIIYYGKNLENYIQIEFGVENQSEIEVNNIKPIPFWTDIM